jgi:hypothetical protein
VGSNLLGRFLSASNGALLVNLGWSVEGDVCVVVPERFWERQDRTSSLGSLNTFDSWATIKGSWRKVKMFDAAEWSIQRFVAEGETDNVDRNDYSWAYEGEGIAFRLDDAPRSKGDEQADPVD